MEETLIDRVGGYTVCFTPFDRRRQVSPEAGWPLSLDLLTPHKPSDRAPQQVLVGLFDPEPLELAAVRLSFEGPAITPETESVDPSIDHARSGTGVLGF